MNFEYMPELSWRYGYFTVWGIMLVLAIILLFFFRRRDWI
jgi:magnesium transporter